MVTLSQRESDRQTWVDANGGAAAHKKVSSAKISSDGGGLLFREIARPLVRPEGGGRCASKSAIVVVIMLVGEIWRALESGVHGRRGEGLHGGRGVMWLVVLGIRVWICASGAETSFKAALWGSEGDAGRERGEYNTWQGRTSLHLVFPV